MDRRTWYWLLFPIISAFLMVPNLHADEGRSVWKGRWNSATTGHSGPMRVSIQPRPDGQLDARFVGRFAVVIPFTYKATLTPVECNDCGMVVTATKKLGPVLGAYQMTGTLDAAQFQANFQAGKDSGSFHMQRVR